MADDYYAEADHDTLTIGDVIRALQELNPDDDATAWWDGIEWPLHNIAVVNGRAVINCDSIDGSDSLERYRQEVSHG